MYKLQPQKSVFVYLDETNKEHDIVLKSMIMISIVFK